MTEPVDPNAAPPPWPGGYQPPPPYPPPSAPPPPYTPPPPSTPPPAYAPPPWSPPAEQAAPYPQPQQWVLGPDGVPVPAWPPAEPPPPQRRRTTLIVALVTVVVIAAGVGAYALVRGNGSSHRLTIPASFDGYTQLHNSNSDRVEQEMRSLGSGSGMGAVFDAATIGSYAYDSGDVPRLVAIVLPTSKVPSGAGGSADQIVSGLLTIVGSGVRSFPAGPHGGSAECGVTQFGAVQELMCAWSDTSTTGILVSVLRPISVEQLDSITNDFRDAVD